MSISRHLTGDSNKYEHLLMKVVNVNDISSVETEMDYKALKT